MTYAEFFKILVVVGVALLIALIAWIYRRLRK